jgi:hypothetical protein
VAARCAVPLPPRWWPSFPRTALLSTALLSTALLFLDALLFSAPLWGGLR